MSRPVIAIGKCLNCGDEFNITSKNPKQKYCSVNCWTQSKTARKMVSETQTIRHKHWKEEDRYIPTKERFDKICPNCGKQFQVQPSRLFQTCCSQHCASVIEYRNRPKTKRMRLAKTNKQKEKL